MGHRGDVRSEPVHGSLQQGRVARLRRHFAEHRFGERDADESARPERQVEVKERSAQVRNALASLPPQYRAVVELRHYQELSYDEIATELKIPLSDVKSHLFRARKILAEKLHASD